MPSSNSLRHPETERCTPITQDVTLSSTACSMPMPHPALVALASLMGRAAAREVLARMHPTLRADRKPSRH
jgi:hypothetical protein